jgi:Fe-Mn family superoxide dismutase
MKKRDFIKLTGVAGAGMVVSPFLACSSGDTGNKGEASGNKGAEAAAKAVQVFELPALGFATDALQPSIDQMTMEIHHGKHHAGYVRKLNAALEGNGNYGGMSLEEILANVGEDESGVRNNGGGHYNHSLFWEILKPGGEATPSGQLNEAINSAFGSYDAFSENFFNAAKARFGSGWAWLSVDNSGKLFVTSTPNQDNPLMSKITDEKGTPILGIDVWEHAYYLNYQNKRGDYINAFMDIINWDVVAEKFAMTMK